MRKRLSVFLLKGMKAYLPHNAGSVAVMAVIAIPLLITAAGVAIDMNRYLTVRSKLATALDTALLSAATVVETQDPTTVANEYFLANVPQNYKNMVSLGSMPVTLTPSDPTTILKNGKMTGTVHTKLSNSFASFIGLNVMDINLQAAVGRGLPPKVEIAMTADISPSMCATITQPSGPVNGEAPLVQKADPSCKKLRALQNAMGQFVTKMSQNASIKDLSIGIIPYSHKIKFPNTGQIPPPLKNAEPSGYYSSFTDVSAPFPTLYPLTQVTAGSAGNTVNWINGNLASKPNGIGWTRSNISGLASLMMLDPQYSSYFRNKVTPAAFHDATSDKTVIMMTDGANISCCYASFPIGNQSNQYLYMYAPDNAHLKMVCDQLKADGVRIFTVVFDVSSFTTSGQAIKDLYHYCATPTGDPGSLGYSGTKKKPFFFDVTSTNGTDLTLAYMTIAQSFFGVHLIQ